MANRRVLLKAIDDVEAGKLPPGMAQTALASQRIGPDTVDGIAPAHGWETWWRNAVDQKRKSAPWNAAVPDHATEPESQT
jgi:hypothetical protein